MDVTRQRPEARAVRSRREPIGRRQVASIAIQSHDRLGRAARGSGIAHEPLGIDHGVAPAEALQVPAHPQRIGAELLLRDGGPVGVIAVPSHGGRRGEDRPPTHPRHARQDPGGRHRGQPGPRQSEPQTDHGARHEAKLPRLSPSQPASPFATAAHGGTATRGCLVISRHGSPLRACRPDSPWPAHPHAQSAGRRLARSSQNRTANGRYECGATRITKLVWSCSLGSGLGVTTGAGSTRVPERRSTSSCAP